MIDLGTCSKCPTVRSPETCYKQKGGRAGLHSWCKQCVQAARKQRTRKPQKRNWLLHTRYRLTPEQVDKMRADQGGLCGICRRPMKRECIDHDHKTRKVRGLLCHGCNIKLPSVENDEYRVAAIEYLEKHR